jgi:hypothetical protein
MGGEHGVAVFAALALLNANRHPRRVDIADSQVQDLIQPQPSGIGRHQHRPMLLVGGVGDEPVHFLTTHEGRQFARLPRGRDRERRPVALQRRVVKEAEAVDHDVAGTPGPPTLLQQMPEIRLHFGIGNLVRPSPVIAGQARHRPQVRLTRPIGKPPHDHVLVHPPTKLRHDTPPHDAASATPYDVVARIVCQ